MTKKRIIDLLGFILPAAFAAGANAADLLNGSFEAPAIIDNSARMETPASWTLSSGTATILNGAVGVGAGAWPLARDGRQYVNIDASGPTSGPNGEAVLSQGFAIDIAGSYKLSWSDSDRGDRLVGGLPSGYSVDILDSLGNRVVSQQFFGEDGIWNDRALLFALTTGNYTVSFRSNGLITLLDNVALAQVPVPAAVWLMGSALLAMVRVRGTIRD